MPFAKARDDHAGLPVKVTVVPLAWLEEAIGKREMVVELPEGAKVGDALRSLGVDDIEYASAVLNSEQAHEDAPLADGDTLYVFPPIAGGGDNSGMMIW